jgi:hypothetical protein
MTTVNTIRDFGVALGIMRDTVGSKRAKRDGWVNGYIYIFTITSMGKTNQVINQHFEDGTTGPSKLTDTDLLAIDWTSAP